jgi:hypothetical protein
MAHNPDVHWLLLTDQPVADAPPNLTVHLCQFSRSPIASGATSSSRSPRPSVQAVRLPARLRARSSATSWPASTSGGTATSTSSSGRIRDHLPPAAFEADKILFQGNFSLYRNTPEMAGLYRHEVGRISYRDVMTTPEARHFDEWAGIYYIVEGPRCALLARGARSSTCRS